VSELIRESFCLGRWTVVGHARCRTIVAEPTGELLPDRNQTAQPQNLRVVVPPPRGNGHCRPKDEGEGVNRNRRCTTKPRHDDEHKTRNGPTSPRLG